MSDMREITSRYLGDGVYAGFDGYQMWLVTDVDGVRHSIALDVETSEACVEYAREIFHYGNVPITKAPR